MNFTIFNVSNCLRIKTFFFKSLLFWIFLPWSDSHYGSRVSNPSHSIGLLWTNYQTEAGPTHNTQKGRTPKPLGEIWTRNHSKQTQALDRATLWDRHWIKFVSFWDIYFILLLSYLICTVFMNYNVWKHRVQKRVPGPKRTWSKLRTLNIQDVPRGLCQISGKGSLR
jgi:hypothetical protein